MPTPPSRESAAHSAAHSAASHHLEDQRSRSTRPLATRIAQGGVVVALAVAIGVVLVNPATGDGGLSAPGSGRSAGPDDSTRALAATRVQATQVADVVAARAEAVRADGAQAQVPADQLAQLDALRSQVDALVGKVQAESVQARKDRASVASRGSSATRSTTDPGTSSTPAASSTPTASADPTSTAAALAEPSPTTSSAPDAGSTAGTTPDSAVAATPAADPSASTAAGTTTSGATTAPGATAAGATAAATTAPGPGAPTAGALVATPIPGPTSTATSPAPTVDTPDQVAAAIPPVLATDDPDAAQLRDAVIALARSTQAVSAAVDANRTAAKAAQDAAAQQAAAAAEAAAAQAAADAQRAAWKTSLQGYPNGQIPASALCAPTFDGGALLRCDAAEALDNLDAAYAQAFGTHLTVNDSYRSYAAQVACLSTRGWLCATPGTSNHGLGIAVDLGGGIEQTFSAQHRWMVANAAAFGFVHPAWAEPGGSKPEPWHWEYTG